MDTIPIPEELRSMSDQELRTSCSGAIFYAAIMTNTQWSDGSHAIVDAYWVECKNRSRGIYQHAYNDVLRSQGHQIQSVNPEGA